MLTCSRSAAPSIATFATECRTKHIKLELVIGGQLKALYARGCKVFMADPVRIGQICLNLVSNAIRFTGQPRPRHALREISADVNALWIVSPATAPTRRITFHLDVRRNPPVDDSCRVPPEDFTDESLPPDSPYYLYGAVEDTGYVGRGVRVASCRCGF